MTDHLRMIEAPLQGRSFAHRGRFNYLGQPVLSRVSYCQATPSVTHPAYSQGHGAQGDRT